MQGFYPKGSRVFPQKFVVPATQKAVSIVIDGNVIVVVTIVVGTANRMENHVLFFVAQGDSTGFFFSKDGVELVLGLGKPHQFYSELAAAGLIRVAMGNTNSSRSTTRNGGHRFFGGGAGDHARKPSHQFALIQSIGYVPERLLVGFRETHQPSSIRTNREEVVGDDIRLEGGLGISAFFHNTRCGVPPQPDFLHRPPPWMDHEGDLDRFRGVHSSKLSVVDSKKAGPK